MKNLLAMSGMKRRYPDSLNLYIQLFNNHLGRCIKKSCQLYSLQATPPTSMSSLFSAYMNTASAIFAGEATMIKITTPSERK
jgi:hypothetical protein